MPQFVEFVTGTWVEGLDADVGHEAEALSGLLTRGVLDAVLALAMFEQARNAPHDHSQAAWERDRQLERIREEELASEDPRDCTAPDFMEWRMRISEQARRDVVRAKWEAGELPDELKHRLPFLHAQTFVTALAQVGRAMYALAELDTGSAKVELLAARDDFAAALPTLKHVRDSVEHAEDRLRGHPARPDDDASPSYEHRCTCAYRRGPNWRHAQRLKLRLDRRGRRLSGSRDLRNDDRGGAVVGSTGA